MQKMFIPFDIFSINMMENETELRISFSTFCKKSRVLLKVTLITELKKIRNCVLTVKFRYIEFEKGLFKTLDVSSISFFNAIFSLEMLLLGKCDFRTCKLLFCHKYYTRLGYNNILVHFI